jgi:hypothetical protein
MPKSTHKPATNPQPSALNPQPSYSLSPDPFPLSTLLDSTLTSVLIAANALAESLRNPESIEAKDLAARANAANAMANMATRLHQIKLAEQAANPAPEPEFDPDAPVAILEFVDAEITRYSPVAEAEIDREEQSAIQSDRSRTSLWQNRDWQSPTIESGASSQRVSGLVDRPDLQHGRAGLARSGEYPRAAESHDLRGPAAD